MTVSIFNTTSSEFIDKVAHLLGKGKRHALDYYKHFFKQGDGLKGYNKQEKQAYELFCSIDKLIQIPSWTVNSELLAQQVEKYVLAWEDKHVAELVIIEMKTGLTLCISSQVGCKMACSFCETGRMGKLRDLSVEEIIAQVYFAKFVLNKKIKNIVFMGMGEPFDNFEHLLRALDILIDPLGFGFAPSAITVSTSGIVPKIIDFIPLGQKGIKLAISINGSNDHTRQQVMPINRRYNMSILHKAMVLFTSSTQSQILAEYVLMKGVNDQLDHAKELAMYLKDIPCIINLIPYNAQSNQRFSPPDQKQIKLFQTILIDSGFKTYVRQNKGDRIMAACGQLGQLHLKKSLLQKDTLFLRCH